MSVNVTHTRKMRSHRGVGGREGRDDQHTGSRTYRFLQVQSFVVLCLDSSLWSKRALSKRPFLKTLSKITNTYLPSLSAPHPILILWQISQILFVHCCTPWISNTGQHVVYCLVLNKRKVALYLKSSETKFCITSLSPWKTLLFW